MTNVEFLIIEKLINKDEKNLARWNEIKKMVIDDFVNKYKNDAMSRRIIVPGAGNIEFFLK